MCCNPLGRASDLKYLAGLAEAFIGHVSAQRPRFPFSKRSATPVYDDHPVAVAAVVWGLIVLAPIGVVGAALAVEPVPKIVHAPEPRR
jgi:hypothetical protein